MDRRKFLTYVGSSTAAVVAASTGLGTLAGKAEAEVANHLMGDKPAGGQGKPLTAPFRSVERQWTDDVVLPPGYSYNIIVSYGETINSQGEKFGDAVDLTVYFPMDSLEGGTNSEEGLIWVNHEFPEPQNYVKILGINPDSINPEDISNIPNLLQIEKEAVGGSVLHIKRQQGQWKLVMDDDYNHRVDGNTTIQLTGPAAQKTGRTVKGTLGNCSGGRTLWNTVLSCEENTNYDSSYGWPNFNRNHYGWVVEVDPFDPDRPVRKHTALGKFRHENAAMGLTKDGRLAVYMGDDARGEFFYKFISKKKYNPHNREANFSLLESGTLYVADLGGQRWIPLDYSQREELQNYEKDGRKVFQNQADVLINAPEAGRAVGATPLDRPEDVEIHPYDQSVYLALTNNSNHGNFHGQVIRFIPADDDHGNVSFTFEVFIAGGEKSGITCPDNLHFDSEANLWVVEDYSATEDNVYAAYKNCGCFMIPTDGREYGVPQMFASGPAGCEMTGPWFTPNERTLFLDVQHPNTWNPYPSQDFGRSALIAVQGLGRVGR